MPLVACGPKPIRQALATGALPPLTSAPGQTGFLDALASEVFGRIGFDATVVRLPAERALINANAGIEDGDMFRAPGFEKDFPNLAPAVALQRVGESAFDVLYVEDKASNVEVIAAFVAQHANIHLRTAGTGEAGLALARERRPDIVLLDIHLPGMDGYQVLQQLRADPRLVHIPVVALSADAMLHDIRRGLAAGFDRYIAKPVNLHELLGVLNEVLGTSRAQRSRR